MMGKGDLCVVDEFEGIQERIDDRERRIVQVYTKTRVKDY